MDVKSLKSHCFYAAQKKRRHIGCAKRPGYRALGRHFPFFGFVFIECLFIMLFMLYKGNIQIQASESSGQYQDVSSMVSTLI